MSLGTILWGRQWRVHLCLHLKLQLSKTYRRFLRETRTMMSCGFIKKRGWCIEGWIWELRCSDRNQVTGKEDGKCSKQNSRTRNQGCERGSFSFSCRKGPYSRFQLYTITDTNEIWQLVAYGFGAVMRKIWLREAKNNDCSLLDLIRWENNIVSCKKKKEQGIWRKTTDFQFTHIYIWIIVSLFIVV